MNEISEEIIAIVRRFVYKSEQNLHRVLSTKINVETYITGNLLVMHCVSLVFAEPASLFICKHCNVELGTSSIEN